MIRVGETRDLDMDVHPGGLIRLDYRTGVGWAEYEVSCRGGLLWNEHVFGGTEESLRTPAGLIHVLLRPEDGEPIEREVEVLPGEEKVVLF